MTDVVLVAVKLEHECELRCFRIVALHQNALSIELFAENRRCKVGGDECDLQIRSDFLMPFYIISEWCTLTQEEKILSCFVRFFDIAAQIFPFISVIQFITHIRQRKI